MTCSNISRPWRATALLLRRRPSSGAAVGLPERSAAAAAGQAAGGDDRDAIAGGGAVHRAIGTDGASGGLADNLAAGDDDRVAAGALTGHADAADDPGAIEIVAATSAAFAPARRGSSASGSLRRAGFDGFGAAREPDSDFSSLPMLPPALPDCASARPEPHTSGISRARIGSERRTAYCMSRCFQSRE